MKIRISLFLFVLFAISCEQENKAPIAAFFCYPPEGNIHTVFDLDAGNSLDPDGLKSLLLYRWDYNGDGIWDTQFGSWQNYSCSFPEPGTYEIKVEVKDSHGAVGADLVTVFVDSLHSITDPRDGQVYPVFKLGSYWWTGRNLNYGTPIDPSTEMTYNGITEKYLYPGDDPEGLNGGLYTWNEMMGESFTEGSRGICPPGWHVATDSDWKNMLSVFRAPAIHFVPTYQIWGEKWVPDMTVTHNNYQSEGAIWRLLRESGNTGFDAVLLGYRDPDGIFDDRDYHFPGHTATFWTSTQSGDLSVRVRIYRTDDHQGDLFRLADNRRFAFSVRCVKETL